jgi:hypothetical protein
MKINQEKCPPREVSIIRGYPEGQNARWYNNPLRYLLNHQLQAVKPKVMTDFAPLRGSDFL